MSNHRNSDRTLGKRGLTVDVRAGRDEKEAKSNLEHALKTLKRRLLQEGLVKDIRKNEFHETKGQIKRRKRNEAVRRMQKLNRAKKD